MLKGDLRKQAILDTAEQLFFDKGYAGTTIQDFLDALNCSKGSFYHHFESKLQVLTALCHQRAGQSFAEYQEQRYDDNLARLNGLIYYAMPFRISEEKNLALLLPLEGLMDGSVVLQSVVDAQKELFFPELCSLLGLLKAEGVFHYSQPMLPELLWDTYTAVYRKLLKEAASIQNGGATGNVVQLIEGERFIWERLLDAPFGSMELVRGDEALLTISHAVTRIKRMAAQP